MNKKETREAFNKRISWQYRKSHTPQCQKCGVFRPWNQTPALHIHHVIAVADGGTNDDANLVVLCSSCHSEWHEMENNNQNADFEEWLKRIPMKLCMLMLKRDYELVSGFSIREIEDMWQRIREFQFTTEPFKNEECSCYVEKHSGQWIDWHR